MKSSAPYLGAPDDLIGIAENSLGVCFPLILKEAWATYNCVELSRGNWRLFPVFDPTSPRKTSSDIVYQNTKGRGLTPDGFVAIAENLSGSANRLVLRRNGAELDPKVLLLNYSTGKLSAWKHSLDVFLAQARRSRANVEQLSSRFGAGANNLFKAAQ